MSEDRANPDQQSDRSREEPPKRRKPRRSPWLWVAGLAILASGATVYAVPVLDRLEEQRSEIAEFTAELEVLEAENADLEDRLSSLNTPAEIERLARERLGYVRAGETAFVVVPTREEVLEGSGEEQVGEAEAEGGDPWYKQWWNYLSGSDLTEDS